MALSPPALTRSPSSSSNTYCSSDRSSIDYPSPPALVDQQYKLSSIYGSDPRCSMTPPMDSDSSLPPFDALCQPEWTAATVLHPSSSASSMPSILSSEYDAYGSYESSLPPPYGHHDMYQTHHGHSHVVHSSTPPPAGAVSRSPIPSSRSAASYTSAPSVTGSLTPRIKMETAGDYGQGMELSHYPSPRSVHAGYPADNASYSSNASGYLSDGQASWRTSDYQQTLDSDQYYAASGSAASSPFMAGDARRPYRAGRPRRTRHLTKPEEANFRCEVKGCGKLFSRSYNFKAHMETHDDKREYPFPCTVNDCNKKFVRKTDLQRHHQSVHMKERNHKCDYCGRLFARKDTLRRHMEDGCSKRFDIGTLDLRSETYDGLNNSGRPMGGGAMNLMVPQSGGLPPMSMLPGSDQHQGHSWGR